MLSDVINLSPELLDPLAGSTSTIMTLRERGCVTRENALVFSNILFSGVEKLWGNAEKYLNYE